jgi:two-component system sensor kinase FixL
MNDLTAKSSADFEHHRGVQLSALLAAAVDAIIMIDERGRIETFSAAAEKMFGYRAADVLGCNVSVLMPEPYQHQHDHYIQNYLSSGQAKIIGIGREVQAQRKDGTVFPIDLSVGEFTLGREGGFVGIIRDITDKKRAEEKLTSLGKIIEESVNEIYVFDAQTLLFVEVNRGARENLGFTLKELRQLTPVDLKPEYTRERFDRLLLPLRNGEKEKLTFSTRHRRKDGSEYPVSVHLQVGRYGAVPCFVAIILDATEQEEIKKQERQHRDQLTHVARLSTLGEMAAGIAHEINQPLTAITTYAQACLRFLESGDADSEELQSALRKVGEQGQRAGHVVQKLRTLVKQGAAPRELVDCNQLIRDAMTLGHADARDHGIAIHLELAPALPPVYVDTVQIQQVLLNLIRNSIDAMEEAGRKAAGIRVTSTRPSPTEVEISVIDHGAGVSEEAESELFNPFFTTKESGMGMGLSISRSLVAAHGGKLRYTRNPDSGSTFSFRLPTTRGD